MEAGLEEVRLRGQLRRGSRPTGAVNGRPASPGRVASRGSDLERAAGMIPMSHTCKPIPPRDPAFAGLVARCDEALRGQDRLDPRALEQRLRSWFPQAVVRPEPSSLRPVWRVYRDGLRANRLDMVGQAGWMASRSFGTVETTVETGAAPYTEVIR
jgi:hypothetical protein